MKPSEVLELRRPLLRSVVARHRVVNPRVFGSVLSGSDHVGSDLDILVDTVPGTTLLDLGLLQEDLEDAFGGPVDVVTPSDLPIAFRQRVLAEAEAL